MINKNWGALKRIKLTTLAVCLLTGFSTTAQAYKMSSGAKGKCPKGYYRIITEPAEFPKDHKGAVTEYKLPSNVCVKRTLYAEYNSKVNFGVEDFIAIQKNGSLKPFKNVQFRADKYEAVAGHYARSNGSYYDSADYESNDFSGMHPFLVSTTANATIRYKKGVYLINKQTTVHSLPKEVGLCPTKYSRVGNSKTCYAHSNALKINQYDRLELIDIKRAKCPSGYTIEAPGGICTTEAAWDYKEFYGLAKTPSQCPDGYDRAFGQCLPRLTAVKCMVVVDQRELSKEDSLAQILSDRGDYTTSYRSMIRPTSTLSYSKARLNYSDYKYSVYAQNISVSLLKEYSNHFPDDETYFRISRLDKGSIPILQLHSGRNCKDIWDSGWSLDPIPMWW